MATASHAILLVKNQILVQLNGPVSTAAAQGFTFVDMSATLPTGVQIVKIGVYSTTARTYNVKIVKRNSSNNYDVPISQAYAHGGTGWEDPVLTVPFLIPTGTYYCAAFCSAGGANPNVTGGVNRAYLSGDLTGNGATTTSEDTGNSIFPLRYTYTS